MNFIKTLNPFPAANFSSSAQQNFIEPDVKVTIEKGSIEKDNLENGEIFYSKEEFLKASSVNCPASASLRRFSFSSATFFDVSSVPVPREFQI